MTLAPDSIDTLPRLPSWVTSARAETPEDVAFLSGAALAHLHLVVQRADVPQSLLRARLALRAAEVCVMHQGRPERARELRDSLAFLQPDDSPGPAGEAYLAWQKIVARPVSLEALQRALPAFDPDQIAIWLDGPDPAGALPGAPVARSAGVLQGFLANRARETVPALVLADAVLARALGWRHVQPLLGLGLKRTDFPKTGDELRMACHKAIVAAAAEVTREAADLSRRVDRLRTVAPKLRAKGAEAAVEVFFTQDAAPATALTSLRSARAARRFCDRLVELGAVRELTGRDTFRLYGV
jgi:hypothetical protein